MPFYAVIDNFDVSTIAKSVCVVPAIAHGGVGQISVDILLSSIPFTLIGRFISDHVAPCVTVSAIDETPVSTSVECFHSAEHSLLVIQQRGPALHGHQWATELTEWLKEVSITRLMVLSGIKGLCRIDSQLTERRPVRQVVEASVESAGNTEPRYLEQVARFVKAGRVETASVKAVDGTGNTYHLIGAANRAELEYTAFFIFTEEGDNRLDAHALLETIRPVVGGVAWTEPKIWGDMFIE